MKSVLGQLCRIFCLWCGPCLLLAYASIADVWAEDSVGGGAINTDIYLVDIQRVINESIAGKAARNNIETEVKKADSKLSVIRNEVQKFREDTEKQAALLSPSALDERRETLARRERDLQRAAEDRQEELNKKNSQEIGKVVEKIDQVIKDLASSGKYPVIMERDPRFVVYANDRFDISEIIVKKLDEGQL